MHSGRMLSSITLVRYCYLLLLLLNPSASLEQYMYMVNDLTVLKVFRPTIYMTCRPLLIQIERCTSFKRITHARTHAHTHTHTIPSLRGDCYGYKLPPKSAVAVIQANNGVHMTKF